MPQGFFIQVHNQLLDTKHYLAMRESVWLFMWCLDRITIIDENGIGWVLGKKPVKFEDVKKYIPCSPRNYKRWIACLRDGGYILTIRAPNGLIVGVNKAKKKFKNDVDKSKSGCVKNGTSDVPKMAHRGAKNGTSKYIGINQSVDITVDTVISNLAKGKKPYYQGKPMWISEDGWRRKVLENDDKWHEFGGPNKSIEWR